MTEPTPDECCEALAALRKQLETTEAERDAIESTLLATMLLCNDSKAWRIEPEIAIEAVREVIDSLTRALARNREQE